MIKHFLCLDKMTYNIDDMCGVWICINIAADYINMALETEQSHLQSVLFSSFYIYSFI